LLIFVAPFVAIGLVVSYIVGRLIKHPKSAAIASGLTGLSSFLGSLVATIAVLVGDGGASPGAAFIVMVLFLVVVCLAPVFVALSYIIYRNRKRAHPEFARTR
jgi:hypothetical protein